MARWARLELATDDLENRCSIQLSYHRVYTPKHRLRLDLHLDLDKLKPERGWTQATEAAVPGDYNQPNRALAPNGMAGEVDGPELSTNSLLTDPRGVGKVIVLPTKGW